MQDYLRFSTLATTVRDTLLTEVHMGGTFRDLKCWQKAFDLTVAVYAATRAFPKEELFALSNQLRRAAISVMSNIAEGKGRLSDKDSALLWKCPRIAVRNRKSDRYCRATQVHFSG